VLAICARHVAEELNQREHAASEPAELVGA
jgi:hypothetical protein